MSISEQRAQELAALLPEKIGCENDRRRLLCVAEILHMLTDADHPLSNSDIRSIIAARFGRDAMPAENTLNRDIGALRECGALGYVFRTGTRGTWCEHAALAPASVRLCLNAVQSSRFLTSEQSADLQDALGSLVSRWREEELAYDVHVTQREREGAEVLARCDAAAEALRLGKKVEFEYAYNDFDGRQVPLPRIDDTGETNDTLRVETPIALIFSQGFYYLESYSDPPWRHANTTRSRIDRMTFLRVSREDADANAEVRRLRRSAARRMGEDFDLLGGKPRTVFLRVMGRKTNEMIDRFGFDLRYRQFEGPSGADTSTAITCVRVAESPAFLRWLAGTGGEVALVSPPVGATAKRGPWAAQCKGMTAEELAEDYRAMAEAYRMFLERAASALPA